MRFVKEEIADPKGKAKRRLMFALGIEEAKIIYSLLKKAFKFMPEKDFEASSDAHRIENMVRRIGESLPEFEKSFKKKGKE